MEIMYYTTSIPIHIKGDLEWSPLAGNTLSELAFNCQFPTIERFYSHSHGKLEKAYRDFVNYWSKEGKELPKPRLYLYLCGQEESRRKEWDLPLVKGTQKVVCALWTLGKILEERVSTFMNQGEHIQGMILDVAASRVLVEMHEAVQGWIKQNLAQPKNWNIVGEHYPENSSMEKLLSDLILLSEADEEISILKGTSMLLPQKTQYSFFQLGDGAPAELNKTIRCTSCRGRRCIYWQMGGCHLIDDPLLN